MIGITHQVNIAPPVNHQSIEFIVTMLIPIAILKDSIMFMPFLSVITVSSAIPVSGPSMIASIIIPSTGQAIPLI